MTTAARAYVLGHGTTSVPSLLRSPILALILAALFWGGSFVVGRALRDDIDPVALTFFRWLIALLVFAPFAWREIASHAYAVRRGWRLIVGLGATGIVLFHPLVYVALQYTSATNALLTFSLSPVLILLGASVASRKRPTARESTGVLLSMAGADVLPIERQIVALGEQRFDRGDEMRRLRRGAAGAVEMVEAEARLERQRRAVGDGDRPIVHPGAVAERDALVDLAGALAGLVIEKGNAIGFDLGEAAERLLRIVIAALICCHAILHTRSGSNLPAVP